MPPQQVPRHANDDAQRFNKDEVRRRIDIETSGERPQKAINRKTYVKPFIASMINRATGALNYVLHSGDGQINSMPGVHRILHRGNISCNCSCRNSELHQKLHRDIVFTENKTEKIQRQHTDNTQIVVHTVLVNGTVDGNVSVSAIQQRPGIKLYKLRVSKCNFCTYQGDSTACIHNRRRILQIRNACAVALAPRKDKVDRTFARDWLHNHCRIETFRSKKLKV